MPEAPAEEPGCSADSDCSEGKLCAAGSCVAPDGPRPSECATSVDCRAEPSTLVPDVYWDGDDAICTLDPEGCEDGSCDARRVCLPPGESATRPGAVRCSSDAQCTSGRCIEHAGDRVCFRACSANVDCAGGVNENGELVGDGCALVEVAGASLGACVPAVPGRTLCRRDCDCGDSDDCGPVAPSELHCRFAPDPPHLPRCEPLPAEAVLAPASRCRGPALCGSGACMDACTGVYDWDGKTFCSSTQYRCSQPCGDDGDCPQRTQCLPAPAWLRVGTWHLPGETPKLPGRDLRYCQLPKPGCYDDQDCFSYFEPEGDEVKSWGPDQTRCGVQFLRVSTSPRVVTVCLEPDPALGPPGSCCESHEACDTGICVPVAAGAACPTGICTVPCDISPDPDGIPGTGDERDRCARLPQAPALLDPWFAGTRCQELAYERELTGDDGISRPFATTLRVCR